MTADGEDADTLVWWMQAGETHVDLRLPPDLDATPPSRARCEGFAGRTVVRNGTATWHREVNLQGPVAKPDVGVLTWDGDDLIEDAPDGSYREVWVRERSGPAHAQIEMTDARMRVVAWAADRFMLADARPDEMELPQTLAERVAAGATIDAAFSIGDLGLLSGTVTHSTDPALVGAVLDGAPEAWNLGDIFRAARPSSASPRQAPRRAAHRAAPASRRR